MKNKPPELVLFDDGTMFVILRTLDELDGFWRENKKRFEFACRDLGGDGSFLLSEYEWIFGSSKSDVVRRVFCWDERDISCEFFDWAKNDPAGHASFFQERDAGRTWSIDNGLWSDEDELAYQVDCIRRTPDTYRGWWRLKNFPFSYDSSSEELSDQSMPIAEVERTLQEQIFDEWKMSDVDSIKFHDRDSIKEEIAYWRSDQADGRVYYGEENEH